MVQNPYEPPIEAELVASPPVRRATARHRSPWLTTFWMVFGFTAGVIFTITMPDAFTAKHFGFVRLWEGWLEFGMIGMAIGWLISRVL